MCIIPNFDVGFCKLRLPREINIPLLALSMLRKIILYADKVAFILHILQALLVDLA